MRPGKRTGFRSAFTKRLRPRITNAAATAQSQPFPFTPRQSFPAVRRRETLAERRKG
jgi:hypothetical protein